ncbi:MAG: hypothetical protein JOZ07_11505 [Solirubrobacterales bacterium]|nr:hypothetical protein [Solirubrobacterales bacterium]
MTQDQTTVALTRTIPAPPPRVDRAWLAPELLQRWLAAGSMRVTPGSSSVLDRLATKLADA